MENIKRSRQKELLEAVIEVAAILRERRPDLETTAIRALSEAEALLEKDSLSDDDFTWLEENILAYLCHPRCLYDFCPLERLDGETDRALWGRWGEIVDRMKNRMVLLFKDTEKKSKRGR